MVTQPQQMAGRRPHIRGLISSPLVPRASSTDAENLEFVYKYPSWDSIHYELTNKYDLRSVDPVEAASLVESGKAVLVDVRPQESHTEYHPEGAMNVPAFRIIEVGQDGGLGSFMKFAVMKFNGVTPTEANPHFPDLMKDIASSSEQIFIFACEQGGTTSPTTTFPTGKVSRSLKACWRLLYNGVIGPERVLHLEGGVRGWRDAGLNMNVSSSDE